MTIAELVEELLRQPNQGATVLAAVRAPDGKAVWAQPRLVTLKINEAETVLVIEGNAR